MLKSDIVARISEMTGATKHDTTAILDAFIIVTQEAIKNDHDVKLPGLGTFMSKHKGERDVRNPMTGEMIHVGEQRSVRFKPSATFKNAIKLEDGEV